MSLPSRNPCCLRHAGGNALALSRIERHSVPYFIVAHPSSSHLSWPYPPHLTPPPMIDRTLNTIVKDVILKGIIVVYDDQSPTRNRKAAVQKMLEADEFIANNGADMTVESLSHLETLSDRLIESGRNVSTRWRDVITHPVTTYKNARDFNAAADNLLSEAITASSRSNLQRIKAARQAENAVQQIRVAQTVQASHDTVVVAAPIAQANVVAAATSSLSAPPPTDFETARSPGVAGDAIAYVRFGDSDIRVGPNTKAKIEFDREAFSMVLIPIRPPMSAPVNQPVRTVRRTTSVFTASGTARIVSQPHTSSGESSQSDGDDVSTCRFEWLEGPVITDSELPSDQ